MNSPRSSTAAGRGFGRAFAGFVMSDLSHAGHDHAHGHDQAASSDGGRLGIALGITVTFMVVEAVGGWIAGSLALIADSGHMLVESPMPGAPTAISALRSWPRWSTASP